MEELESKQLSESIKERGEGHGARERRRFTRSSQRVYRDGERAKNSQYTQSEEDEGRGVGIITKILLP
jgi:hypothetical protein